MIRGENEDIMGGLANKRSSCTHKRALTKELTTHANTQMCLCKAAIVGQCDNRPWQLSMAEPWLSAAILLGIRMAACVACTFPCVSLASVCVRAGVCVSEVTNGPWHWSKVKSGVWLTAASAVERSEPTPNTKGVLLTTIRHGNTGIGLSVRPFFWLTDWQTHSLTDRVLMSVHVREISEGAFCAGCFFTAL